MARITGSHPQLLCAVRPRCAQAYYWWGPSARWHDLFAVSGSNAVHARDAAKAHLVAPMRSECMAICVPYWKGRWWHLGAPPGRWAHSAPHFAQACSRAAPCITAALLGLDGVISLGPWDEAACWLSRSSFRFSSATGRILVW